MVQFFETSPTPGFGSTLGQALGQGLGFGMQNRFLEQQQIRQDQRQSQMQQQQQERQRQAQQQQQQQELSALQQAVSQAGNDPQSQLQALLLAPVSNETKKIYGDLLINQQKAEAMQKRANAPKPPPGGLTGQPTPPEVANAVREVLNSNPSANADELLIALDEKGVPRAFSSQLVENRRRQDEARSKGKESKEAEIRKEVFPIKKEISDKAQSARLGIENKEKLLNLIDTGNLADPTFATIAKNLPFDLGKRLLSPETIEYRSGLIEEFGDLRRLFAGQTRVKEIELLEEKIADIYLTDQQKKSVLKSRMDALKADIIREDAAQEVDEKYPDIGIFQFRKKVEEIAKPKLNALFNKILDDQKSIIKSAENKKRIPLDPTDPQDLEIADQILKEAGGDRQKARKLAKEKGYIF